MYFQGIAKLSEDQMLHYEFQTYFQGITKLSELINWCSINFRYNYFQPKDNISNNIPMYQTIDTIDEKVLQFGYFSHNTYQLRSFLNKTTTIFRLMAAVMMGTYV